MVRPPRPHEGSHPPRADVSRRSQTCRHHPPRPPCRGGRSCARHGSLPGGSFPSPGRVCAALPRAVPLPGVLVVGKTEVLRLPVFIEGLPPRAKPWQEGIRPAPQIPPDPVPPQEQTTFVP